MSQDPPFRSRAETLIARERGVDSKEKERVFSRHFYPFYTTGKAPPGGTVFTYQ